MMTSFTTMLLTLVFAAYFPPIMSQISSNFAPPALPLAVKGPYLNAWLFKRDTNLTNWPQFWNGDSAVASFTAVIVDNKQYGMQGAFFGTPSSMTTAPQIGVTYSPTSTIYTVQAGPMLVNATFLTPVTARDLSQQSLPFSYYSLTFHSTDGAAHDVQVYTDFTTEWIASGSNSVTTNGSSITDNQMVLLEGQLVNPTPFNETDDFAQDSTGVYAASFANTQGIEWQIGNFSVVRGFGINGSSLNDTLDPTFSQHVQFSPPGVLAMLANLGSVTDTSSTPFVAAFGVFRNPSIEVIDLAGEKQLRSPFYLSGSGSGSIHDVTLSFLQNYTNALIAAKEFDNTLLSDTITSFESQQYVDLVSLIIRGAMSSLEITLPLDTQGQWDLSDVEAYLKDMGGVQAGTVGASGTVSPVDVLYAAMPMYLYLNPDLLGYLLKPLLQAQQNSAYSGTIGFAAQNMGSQFPKAQLQVVSHKLGVEQSSNMLIMSLAHAQTSGSGNLISTYWAEYLVDNALSPGSQSSPLADAITYPNQTNLALKGITAIAAMGRISSLLKNDEDQARYAGISKNYISQWQSLSVSSDNSHLLLSYGQQACGGLIYNLYADKLLQLDLVPDEIYAMQTAFHKGQLDSGAFTYGLPLDTCSVNVSRVDWTMFTAAVMTDSLVRNGMIELVHQYAGNMFNRTTNAPLMTVYDPTTGNNTLGTNRKVSIYSCVASRLSLTLAIDHDSPSVGSMFSLLALQVPIKNSTSIPDDSHPKALAGIIAGSVVGCLVLLLMIGWGIWRWRLKKKKREDLGEIPQVVSEREDIRTPFLLGGAFGRTRQGPTLIDDNLDLQATPFEYKPDMTSAGSSQSVSDGYFQSVEDTPSTVTTDTMPTVTTTLPLRTPLEPLPDSKTSRVNPLSAFNGETSSASAPSTVTESSAEVASPAGGTNEADYWRREAEVLRQELQELARLNPDDVPPGYSTNAA